MNEFSVYSHYKECGCTISKEGHRRILSNLLGVKEDASLEKRVKASDLLKINAPRCLPTPQEQLHTLVKNLPSVDLYVKVSLDHLVVAADPTSSIATSVMRRYNKGDLIAARSFDDAMSNLKMSCEKHGSYLDSMIVFMIEEFILSDNRSCLYPIVASHYAQSVLATNNATTFGLEQELIIKFFNRFADYRVVELEILDSFKAAIDEFQYDYAALTDVFYLIEKVHKLSPYLPLVDKLITFVSDTMFDLSVTRYNNTKSTT